MRYFKKCLSLLVLLVACIQSQAGSISGNTSKNFLTMEASSAVIDTLPANVIVITKIETPLFATHKIVTNKFIESIPQYKQIPGLLFKAYSFTETASYFGGIYLWQSREAAEKWFTPAWFEGVKQKYKTTGEVIYYEVTAVEKIAPVVAETKSTYWSVVSLGDDKINRAAKGLLRICFVKDTKGNIGHISLWQTEKEARSYFEKNLSANEFFDSPVILNNEK